MLHLEGFRPAISLSWSVSLQAIALFRKLQLIQHSSLGEKPRPAAFLDPIPVAALEFDFRRGDLPEGFELLIFRF